MAASYTYKTLREILKESDRANVEEIEKKLTAISRKELDTRFIRLKISIQTASESGRSVTAKTRHALWLFNGEYTRREIPPSLRGLTQPCDDDRAQIADAFATDLQWLTTTYPKHTSHDNRWRGFFSPGGFHGTVDWVSNNYPFNQMHWFCRKLGLTDDQQRELHFVKSAAKRKEFDELTKGRDGIKIRLGVAYRSRDTRYTTDDPAATIERRLEIWFAGSLANWKPQRTANLYAAITGDVMSRQLAASIIRQVHRDVPESEPKKKYQRMKV